jgi:ATP-dependent Clp protease ATP-binding subunit ClpC
MFERFTDRARRVIMLAQEEARRLNHNYIGTEHILLGLTRQHEGVAAQVLTAVGADHARLRMSVPADLLAYDEQIAQVRGQKRPRSRRTTSTGLRRCATGNGRCVPTGRGGNSSGWPTWTSGR